MDQDFFLIFRLIWIINGLCCFTFIYTDHCYQNSNFEEVCSINDASSNKYILYDVNAQEGFNLRRDVYMRLAIFLKNLPKNEIKWHLVLPPWSDLPHWRSRDIGQQRDFPWGLFFDMQSLKSFAPVLEMYEFLEDHREEIIDHVFILQHFKDISSGNFTWEDQWSIEECQRPMKLLPSSSAENPKIFKWPVLGYSGALVKSVQCLSFHGPASFLQNVLDAFPGRIFVFEHAEVVLHDFYGGEDYWNCRRSMKFSEDLRKVALNFMQSHLESDFIIKSENGYSKGNSYLCAHLRRRDFALSRPKDVPNLEWASIQIKKKLEELNLKTVFLISDEMNEDVAEIFRSLLPSSRVVTFLPLHEIKQKYKDGGVAIIEQIICSYAQHFIGTYESTFSFRIQEERELLNLHPNTTFNRFCGDGQVHCKQPTRWLKT